MIKNPKGPMDLFDLYRDISVSESKLKFHALPKYP